MAENSAIEWTDHTFNPWIGCTKVSPACDNCYAEALATARLGVAWGPHAERRRTAESTWKQPLAWNRRAAREGRRYRVFCASLADVFDNQVPAEWRTDLFRLIEATPHLDWLLLTKRPQNIRKMLPANWDSGFDYSNVWLGTTVANQAEADRNIPHLREIACRVRFLSIEPMLGPIDLDALLYQPCSNWENTSMDPETGAYECCGRCDWTGIGNELAINWVIAGGESGPNARPSHPQWFRDLRDQCVVADVPFMFKQWGEFRPKAPDGPCGYLHPVLLNGETTDPVEFTRRVNAGAPFAWMQRVGKKTAGRLLDGAQHDGMPA